MIFWQKVNNAITISTLGSQKSLFHPSATSLLAWSQVTWLVKCKRKLLLNILEFWIKIKKEQCLTLKKREFRIKKETRWDE